MNKLLLCVVLMGGVLPLFAGYVATERLWHTDFSADDVAKYAIPADVVDAHGGVSGDGALVFRLAKSGDRKIVVRTGVKLSGLFQVEAVVKGKDVTRGPNHWNGPKVMYPYRRANGTMDNPQLKGVYGTYDWQTSRAIVGFPAQGSDLALVLGLEACSGEFQIDSITVSRMVETEDDPADCEVPVDPSLPRGKFLGRHNPDAPPCASTTSDGISYFATSSGEKSVRHSRPVATYPANSGRAPPVRTTQSNSLFIVSVFNFKWHASLYGAPDARQSRACRRAGRTGLRRP